MSKQFPKSYDSVRAAVVAFMRQCDPHMEKLKDRQLLKEEIVRMTGGPAGIGTGLKDTGVHRKVDELGRIVIPKELRTHLGIVDGATPLQIYVDDEAGVLYLQVYNMHRCAICGDDDMQQLTPFQEGRKHLCENCLEEIMEVMDE